MLVSGRVFWGFLGSKHLKQIQAEGLFWVISLGGFVWCISTQSLFGGYVWSLYPIRSPLFRRWIWVCFGSNYSCRTVLMTAKMRFSTLFVGAKYRSQRVKRPPQVGEQWIHFWESLGIFWRNAGVTIWVSVPCISRVGGQVLHGWWFCQKIILKKPSWLNLFEVSKAFHACHLGGNSSVICNVNWIESV